MGDICENLASTGGIKQNLQETVGSSRPWQHGPVKQHSNIKYKKASEVTPTSEHEGTGEWFSY